MPFYWIRPDCLVKLRQDWGSYRKGEFAYAVEAPDDDAVVPIAPRIGSKQITFINAQSLEQP